MRPGLPLEIWEISWFLNRSFSGGFNIDPPIIITTVKLESAFAVFERTGQ